MSFEPPNSPDGIALPQNFGNMVRLFPLSSLVLFPSVVQALHIFEPRYREMMTDALASDELIAMAMTRPNELEPDEPRPELMSMVCIGKIASHNQFEDGRFNVLLVGAQRAKITEEVVTDLPYRMAKVQLVEDSFLYAPDDADSLSSQVIDLFRQLIDRRGLSDVESLTRLLDGGLPLGQLTDLISYACGADSLQQQRVLEEVEVCRRAEILIEILHGLVAEPVDDDASPGDSFPPNFSEN